MARLFAAGPGHLFVALPKIEAQTAGTYSGGTLLTENRPIVYLGTSESPPIIEERRGFTAVHNDHLGASVPFDLMFDGKELWIGATLNRFNYNVYRSLAAVPYQSGADSGTQPFGAVGTLMLQEMRNIWVIVQFPLFSKSAATGFVPGYFARGGIFLGPDKQKVGVAPLSIQVVFQCLPIYDPKTRSFNTYVNSLPSLPDPD